jgi:hypothetical protein
MSREKEDAVAAMAGERGAAAAELTNLERISRFCIAPAWRVGRSLPRSQPAICDSSQPRARRQSLVTVSTETFSMAAVSSTLNPPK